MMKLNIFYSMMIGLFLAVPTALNAIESKPPIVVIDAATVVNETNAAKRAMEYLRQETEDAQKKIDDMEKSLIEKRENLAKKQAVLSPDKFEEEQLRLSKEFREFRVEAQSIQEKLDRQNMKLRKKITDEIKIVVEGLAKERGYQAIVAKNLLLYADDTIDISQEVLKRVNVRLDQEKNTPKQQKKEATSQPDTKK